MRDFVFGECACGVEVVAQRRQTWKNHQNARAKGRCVDCYCISDTRRCAKCKDKEMARRRKRVATGICRDCSHPIDSENSALFCCGCLAVMRQRQNERIAAFKAAGLCAVCGGKKDVATRSSYRCSDCVERENAKMRRRLQNGGYARRRALRAARKAARLCVDCRCDIKTRPKLFIRCAECAEIFRAKKRVRQSRRAE